MLLPRRLRGLQLSLLLHYQRLTSDRRGRRHGGSTPGPTNQHSWPKGQPRETYDKRSKHTNHESKRRNQEQ